MTFVHTDDSVLWNGITLTVPFLCGVSHPVPLFRRILSRGCFSSLFSFSIPPAGSMAVRPHASPAEPFFREYRIFFHIKNPSAHPQRGCFRITAYCDTLSTATAVFRHFHETVGMVGFTTRRATVSYTRLAPEFRRISS